MIRKTIVHPFLLLIPFVILVLIVYLPTTNSFIRIWTNNKNPNYTHGFLLLVISIYLFYRVWKKNKYKLKLHPYTQGIIGIFIISLVWFIAAIGNIQLIQFMSLLLIIILLLVCFFGINQTRLFLFPLILNIFSIPIWDFLNTDLRAVTTVGVHILLLAVNIVHLIEGFNITLRSGSFLIDTGCSGLGQFIVALAIGYLYSFMYPLSWKVRSIVLIFGALTAIITNIIRVFIVVVSGYLTDMQSYFVTVEHVKLGWAVFAIGVFVYLYATNKILTSRGSFTPEVKHIDEPTLISATPSIEGKKLYLILLLLILALICGPILTIIYKKPYYENGFFTYMLPESINNWRETRLGSSKNELKPKFIGNDLHIHHIYTNSKNKLIEINIYKYAWQEQGKEAVNDLNRIYNKKKWKMLSRKHYHPIGNIKSIDIEETVLESYKGDRILVWKWYAVSDTWTSNPIKAKLLNIWGILISDPFVSAYIIDTDITNTQEEAKILLKNFLIAMRVSI